MRPDGDNRYRLKIAKSGDSASTRRIRIDRYGSGNAGICCIASSYPLTRGNVGHSIESDGISSRSIGGVLACEAGLCDFGDDGVGWWSGGIGVGVEDDVLTAVEPEPYGLLGTRSL